MAAGPPVGPDDHKEPAQNVHVINTFLTATQTTPDSNWKTNATKRTRQAISTANSAKTTSLAKTPRLKCCDVTFYSLGKCQRHTLLLFFEQQDGNYYFFLQILGPFQRVRHCRKALVIGWFHSGPPVVKTRRNLPFPA